MGYLLFVPLTFFYFLPGKILACLGGPFHNVGEPYADGEQLPVVVSIHGPRYQARQVQTFPWNGKKGVLM